MAGETMQNIALVAKAAKPNVDTISEGARATEESGNHGAGLKDLAAVLRAAVDCHLPEKKALAKIRKFQSSKVKTTLFEPRIITA